MSVIEQISTADLIPYARNSRTHSDEQVAQIAASIREFGFNNPVLIDAENTIIAGHGRVLAAGRIKLETVPCLRLTHLTDTQRRAYVIADNRIAMNATWDQELLSVELADLNSDDFEMSLLGFDVDELSTLMGFESDKEVIEDEVPELPVDPTTKAGDLWMLGEHRLLCGDSTKAEDVARLMAGAKADLCFTSPPYSDQREYCGNDLSVEKVSDFLPAARNYASVFCVNLGMARKDGAVDTYWDVYIAKAMQSGLKLVSWNIWDRGRAHSVGQMTACFPIEHEFVFVFAVMPPKLIATIENDTAGQRYTCRNRGRDGKLGTIKEGLIRDKRELGTIYFGLPVSENTQHPAQFPVDFPAAYIRSFAGNVYEPFCGSGTTLIAAEQLGRKCYGMEISPSYCDVIVKRWETLTGKKATLEAA